MTRRSKGRPVDYWHGGAPGLREGGYLLPRSVTGSHSYSHVPGAYVGEEDRVHFTVDKRYATFHAAAYWITGAQGPGGGTLYKVEPVGRVEQDPDDAPGVSLMARKARIVRVAQTGVFLSPLEANQALAAHTTFEEGGSVYTPDGWLLAAHGRADRPEVQAALLEQNLALYHQENAWRRAHGRPPLERPEWLIDPPAAIASANREKQRSAIVGYRLDSRRRRES